MLHEQAILHCFLLNFFHFSGQCVPNPCLNNGVCEPKGKRKFKCDCPRPFKGDRCEKGLKTFPFLWPVVGLQTGHTQCTMENKQKGINTKTNFFIVLLSQLKKFVREAYADGVNVCWLHIPRIMSANARSLSSPLTAEIVRSISSSKQDWIPLFHYFP